MKKIRGLMDNIKEYEGGYVIELGVRAGFTVFPKIIKIPK